ncbi:hypothetical protein [Deinococcus sp. UYEF24]
MDEHGFVLDISLQRQRHRDIETTRLFLPRILAEDVICTDQRWSYRAAIREISSLAHVDHQQVISTRRLDNMIERWASVVSAQPHTGARSG